MGKTGAIAATGATQFSAGTGAIDVCFGIPSIAPEPAL